MTPPDLPPISPPVVATPSSIVATGIAILTAWGTCSLSDCAERNADALSFCHWLRQTLSHAESIEVLLGQCAPEALRRVATSNSFDAAETLLLFIGSLRFNPSEVVLHADPEAASAMAALRDDLKSYRAMDAYLAPFYTT